MKKFEDTYRYAIQNCIEKIETAYQQSGYLRDIVLELKDKDIMNGVRKKLYEANMLLINHDNEMSDEKARTIIVTKEKGEENE